MAIVERIDQDVELTEGGRALLERYVHANVAAALSALPPMNQPVAVLCVFVQQDESPGLPDLILVSDAERTEHLRSLELPDDWADLWHAGWMGGSATVPACTPSDAVRADGHELMAVLEPLAMDPARWLLGRIARELATRPLPFPTTDDFVVFLNASDLPEEEIASELAFLAPARAVAQLRRRGLVV